MEQTKQHLPNRYLVRCGPAGPDDRDSIEPARLDAELPCISAPRCPAIVRVTRAWAAYARAIGCHWAICPECKAAAATMVDRPSIEVVPRKACTDCGLPCRKNARCMKCRAKTSEVGGRKSEVRGRKSEVGSQK